MLSFLPCCNQIIYCIKLLGSNKVLSDVLLWRETLISQPFFIYNFQTLNVTSLESHIISGREISHRTMHYL